MDMSMDMSMDMGMDMGTQGHTLGLVPRVCWWASGDQFLGRQWSPQHMRACESTPGRRWMLRGRESWRLRRRFPRLSGEAMSADWRRLLRRIRASTKHLYNNEKHLASP